MKEFIDITFSDWTLVACAIGSLLAIVMSILNVIEARRMLKAQYVAGFKHGHDAGQKRGCSQGECRQKAEFDAQC